MLDVPQVLLSDAAQAAGVEFNTLRNWIARGAVDLSPHDLPAEGRGGRTLLTRRTLHRIALIAELVAYGASPGWAAAASKVFSHHPGTYGDPPKLRSAGELFPDGETLLIIFHPSELNSDPNSRVGQGIRFRYVNINSPDDYQDVFADRDPENRMSSRIVINCNLVLQNVDLRLKEIYNRRRGQEEK